MSLVVLTLIDGLRPDALSVADCPHLNSLRSRGAYSLKASSVMPSVTLPCHMSIFHSVPPTRHGVITNDWMPMARPLPGLVDHAHAAGLQCAFIYNWEQLRNLSAPGHLAFSHCHNNSEDLSSDDTIAKEALRYLANNRPHFIFVYLGTVDTAGHRYGWMSDGYLAQVAVADKALGVLLEALPPDATLLLQSDHGGHDRTHGTESPEDMTIPWMVAGPAIRQNYEIAGAVSLLDTAPTLARLLGIAPHRDWEGRCVEEIFE